MKLGETIDSINALTYRVSLGSKQLLYPYQESVILLTMIDGTQETVNFGARIERQTELELSDIPRSDYFALITYLTSQKGNRVRFTLSNTSENPWGVNSFVSSNVFYATLLDFDDVGEEAYSVGASLYSVRLKLSYTGTASTDVPSTGDTSLLDFCVEIDTVRMTAGCIGTDLTALDALAAGFKVGGNIGYATSTKKVYIYDPSVPKWRYLYTLVADNAAYGLVNGVFYLSAFADISSGTSGSESKNWKSAIINKSSVKFPSYQIDISKGPGVERFEGFSFSLDNTSKFWTFVVNNKITFYGARVKLKFFDRTNGQMILLRTGTNYVNSFDYVDYTFQVEPTVLNENKSYPDKVIGINNFPFSDVSKRGQPVISTYGRWNKGELQISNFSIKSQKFRTGRRYLSVTAYVALDKEVQVSIGSAEFLTLLGIANLTDYPGTNPVRRIYCHIVKQDNQPDVGKTKRIETIVSAGTGITGLRLKSAFVVNPDATAIIEIFMSSVELIADDDAILGFTTPNYLVADSPTSTSIPKQLFASTQGEIEEVPSGIYQEVDPTTNNRLTINTDALDVDNFNNITILGSTKLERIYFTDIPDVLFGVDSHTGVNRGIDFGFYYGLKSNVVTGSIIQGASIQGTGYAKKMVSKDRYTICWQPLGTNTQYVGTRVVRVWLKYQGPNGNFEVVRHATFDIGDTTTGSYVDTTAPAGYRFFYRIEYLGATGVPDTIANYNYYAEAAALPPQDSDGVGLVIGRGDYIISEAVLIWNLRTGQASVEIYRNDLLLDTLVSSTVTSYRIDYAAHGISVGTKVNENSYQIRVIASGTVDSTREWYLVDNTASCIFELKGISEAYNVQKYHLFIEATVTSTPSIQVSNTETGWCVKNFPENNGNAIPPFGLVFTWGVNVERKPDGTGLSDLANAVDVRLLCNFVVRSYYSVNTEVPFFIQLRAVKRDLTEIVLVQHTSSLAGLGLKAQTKGAFAAMLNLPKGQGGNDLHYDTEKQTTGSSGDVDYGIYTGKDMWRLPDFIFADDAFEWNEIQSLYFAVTNAVEIPAAFCASDARGYHIGIGAFGPEYGGPTPFTSVHKDTYILEYKKVFDGGLDAPQFARIDGGVIDESPGKFTRVPNDSTNSYDVTAGGLIERNRHIADRIIYKMLGYFPQYIGKEMRSRLNWICRFQVKESRDLQTMLKVIADNTFSGITLTPDDRICPRTLDIDEQTAGTVFTFTDSNVIKGSISKPIFRRQNEIYQKFRAKYNYEPSVIPADASPEQDKSKVNNPSFTEEMLVGWDLIRGALITGGYQRKIEGETELRDGGDIAKLAEMCYNSTLLFTTGGQINEFGTEKDELFEWFYRPTYKDENSNDDFEYELPNLVSLYGTLIRDPKRSMQDIFNKNVKFRVYTGWTYSFKCNMKYTTYSTLVNGLTDEFGSVDRKIKLMDRVKHISSFHTDSLSVEAFVVGISPDYYNGIATVTLFVPKPPGQLNTVIDGFWNAGFGSRNAADYVFKDNSYGLTPTEQGTFADGGYGTRVIGNYTFPDGTKADSEGEGTGQI